LRRQRLDRAQSRRTDVVFHSFDVVMNHLLVQTEQCQEISEELMPAGNVARESFAGRSKDVAALFFVFELAVAIEPLDRVGLAGL
jgi:hypothetical protein